MAYYKRAENITQQLPSQNHFDMETIERINAVIYGQCIGDAIGLLTEFMNKDDANKIYGNRELEYAMKHDDQHRRRWETGDWTDDSDQMILLLECLTESKAYVSPQTFATKLKKWVYNGFRELGDTGGCGIGRLTMDVIKNPQFEIDPEKIAYLAWEESKRFSAPNGGVMRTSIMGIHQFWDTKQVAENAVKMCTVTHHDQRCKASVVAVSVAISLMLRREHYDGKQFNVSKIIQESFDRACAYFNGPTARENEAELRMYMFCNNIDDLELSEGKSIGYTFKCVGAGFWAFKQDNFRKAIQTVVMNAGDADTNAAVAGALLGCKLGLKCFPKSWLYDLLHKSWLDEKVCRYLRVLEELYRDARGPVYTQSQVNTVSLGNSKGPKHTKRSVDSRSQFDTRSQTILRGSVDKTSSVTTVNSVAILNSGDKRKQVEARYGNIATSKTHMN